MDLRDVFATNLRRLRNARGLSQDDLACEAGVSRSYLSQLEKGAFHASLKIIGRLAKALDAEPADCPPRRARSVGRRPFPRRPGLLGRHQPEPSQPARKGRAFH
jgi:transcriptional regulator with XRE-family HTH domain